jgi:hypothetical protein
MERQQGGNREAREQKARQREGAGGGEARSTGEKEVLWCPSVDAWVVLQCVGTAVMLAKLKK